MLLIGAGRVGGNLVLTYGQNPGTRPVQRPLSSMAFGGPDRLSLLKSVALRKKLCL